MKRQLLLLSATLLCLLCKRTVFAQSTTFKPFFEKVYVQTDREYYTGGEDVWYKAYLVNAQSNYPTSTSNNLYVELITSDATVISRQVVYLQNGAGNGDFRLADTLSTGLYKLRAYTSWMKNFGDNFIYEKSIRIGTPAGTTIKKQTVATTKKPAQPDAGYRLQFFPEGGSIISNVSNIIAFKAEDASGKGVACEGTVIDSKGKTVATFKSSYAGMGSFSLTPGENEFYQVKAVCNTQTINSDLPIALEKGFALSIASTDTANFIATIKTNDATLASLRNTTLLLGGKHAGKLYFEDSIHLTEKESTIKIPARLFPKGVAVITLYDAKLRPNNERLVFIDREPAAVLNVQLNKTSLNANENPVATFQVSFPNNKPTAANLSMAVVDAGIVPASTQNIVNYLLLQSDIKGKIENADNYFDSKNPKRLEQLDLLLLTQGWREFVWTKLAQEGIRIKYMPEPGITISGMVRRSEEGKPLPDANVTLFAPQAKGDKLLFTKTDTSGHYYVDGVYLFGSQRIKLTSKDEKGKALGFISMDSLFKNPLAATKFDTQADTSASFQQFTVKAAANLVTLNKIRDEALRELPGVVVTAKEPRTMVTRNDVITRFGYKDSTFSPTDIDLKDYGDLENYLHHKMPGAMEDVDNGGLYFLGESSSGGGPVHLRPTFFVDNREDMFERMDYYQLPVNQISKIVIKHGISAMTNQHVYQIHLTLKPDAMNKPDFISTEITGYYEARNFYVPQAKMENESGSFLTTVYWVPVIKTSESGFARITIDNQKKKGVCRVVVEGITENGVPLYSVLSYEAK